MRNSEILNSILIALIIISSSFLILKLEVFSVFANSKTDSAKLCQINGYCEKRQ